MFKIEKVKNEVDVRYGHRISFYQKDSYLDSKNITEENQARIIKDFMTPYIKQLQAKYAREIEIDTQKFEEIQLTRIDMIAIKPDQPFPIVVPSFTLVTLDNRLN